jgi:hypothetical protein
MSVSEKVKPKGAMVEQSQLPAPIPTSSTAWRKSTASSGGGNDQCLEVALRPDLVLVRDSKNTTGPILRFAPPTWTGFIGAVQ